MLVVNDMLTEAVQIIGSEERNYPYLTQPVGIPRLELEPMLRWYDLIMDCSGASGDYIISNSITSKELKKKWLDDVIRNWVETQEITVLIELWGEDIVVKKKVNETTYTLEEMRIDNKSHHSFASGLMLPMKEKGFVTLKGKIKYLPGSNMGDLIERMIADYPELKSIFIAVDTLEFLHAHGDALGTARLSISGNVNTERLVKKIWPDRRMKL